VNGDTFTGEFREDKYHGKGQLVTKDGDVYSGDFEGGLKHGKGIFQNSAGDLFEGNFRYDKFDGFGKYTRKEDGTIFEGLFVDWKMIDDKTGTIFYPDGRRYDGNVQNYQAHGEGYLTTSEGDTEVVIRGKFENDKLIEEINPDKMNLNFDDK